MPNSFELKLLDQHWIDGSTDPLGVPDDTTSHGSISLKINGVEISGCEFPDNDLGINQSAVSLMKSVFNDHEPDERHPIFYHGCSIIGTCPNRIVDFGVTHTGNLIRLDRFEVTGADYDAARKKFIKEIYITIPTKDYSAQILPFAEEALDFLKMPHRGSLPTDTKPDWEEAELAALLKVHRELLERLRNFLAQPD